MTSRGRSWTIGLALLGLSTALGGWVALRSVRTPESPTLQANWTARVSLLAGDGTPGVRDDRGPRARFADPFGVAVSTDGSVVIADGVGSHRVRRVAPDGAVTTVAGSVRGWVDGPSLMARFDTPSGVAVGPDGVIYVADTGNNAIRRIAADGIVTTLGGGGASGMVDALGNLSRFNGPIGVALTPAGELIVADTYNDRIRVIGTDGLVRTLAGAETGLADGTAAEARFDTPCGVAVAADGAVFVADTGNGRVRRIGPDGQVSTVWPEPDGGLFRPTAVALDADGALYVSDEGGRIVEIYPERSARVLAGSRVGFEDGLGPDARFRAPSGVAVLSRATVVVSDRRNALIRVVEPVGASVLRLPTPPRIRPSFDEEAFRLTPLLWPTFPQDTPVEITGTMAEMRGAEGQERFHAGLDMRAEQGTVVRAVRDGTVADPIATADFETLNESLRVGPLVYVHQRVGRSRTAPFDDTRFSPVRDTAGALTRMRVKRGSHFEVGDALGTTNAFNHVHLNIGWPREEVNPLAMRLVQAIDRVQPTIAPRGIHVLDELGNEMRTRSKGRLVVTGGVRLVVDAWDQTDGNRADRRLGLYRLGFQVLDATGTPVQGFEHPHETQRFDRLSPDDEAPRLAFAPGSGIPVYGARRTRFLYEVTNRVREGTAARGRWDTTALEPGDYIVRMLVEDFAGNQATANRDLPVTVVR